MSLSHLDDFLSYKPPIVLRGNNHTPSDSTRAPAYFDKHLSEDRILKRVVICPGMAPEFLSMAEDALHSRKAPIYTASMARSFNADAIEAMAQQASSAQINDESGLQTHYSNTAGRLCPIIAATLALNLKDWDFDSLKWEIRKKSGDVKKGQPTRSTKHVIADGFLVSTTDGDDNFPDDFGLAKQFFLEMLVFEFKNLNFDTEDVMDSILRTSDEASFRWISCENPRCAVEDKPSVTICKQGHDAKKHQLRCIQELIEDPQKIKSYASVQEDRKLVPSPPTGAQRATRGNKSGTRGSKANTRGRGSGRRSRQEVVRCAEDGPENPPPADPEESLDPNTKARRILEQIWSVLCKNDATYMVLNFGNKEIICRRQRDTQTLYISDYIDIPKTEYFKLHVGIYYAAILDTLERARLMRRGVPDTWTDSLPVRDLTSAPVELLPSIVRDEVRRLPWLVLRAEVQNSVQKILTDEYMYRREHGSFPNTLVRLDWKTFFSITESLNVYRDGLQTGLKSFRSTISVDSLMLPGGSDAALSVYVKLARGENNVKVLDSEYEVYQRLHSANISGIARVLGFYQNPRTQYGSFAVLLLEDIGKSVAQWENEPLTGEETSARAVKEYKMKEFENILLQIHSAGYELPMLAKKHLMVASRSTDDPIITGIVGLEHAQDISHSITFDIDLGRIKTRRLIRMLLPNPLIRKREGQPSGSDGLPKSASKYARRSRRRFGKTVESSVKAEILRRGGYEVEEGEVASGNWDIPDDTQSQP